MRDKTQTILKVLTASLTAGVFSAVAQYHAFRSNLIGTGLSLAAVGITIKTLERSVKQGKAASVKQLDRNKALKSVTGFTVLTLGSVLLGRSVTNLNTLTGVLSALVMLAGFTVLHQSLEESPL